MLTTFLLILSASQGCTDVKQQCRACTKASGKEQCSNIGIACQPALRICRPKDARMQMNGAKTTKPKVARRPQSVSATRLQHT